MQESEPSHSINQLFNKLINCKLFNQSTLSCNHQIIHEIMNCIVFLIIVLHAYMYGFYDDLEVESSSCHHFRSGDITAMLMSYLEQVWMVAALAQLHDDVEKAGTVRGARERV